MSSTAAKRHDVRLFQALPRTRKILVAGTLLLAGIYWMQGGYPAATPLGVLIGSLSYALTTAELGAAFAGLKWLVQRAFGWPTDFSADWHWFWGFFLVLLIVGHLGGFVHA